MDAMTSSRPAAKNARRKERRPRSSLSREAIIEAAEAIAVRDGLDGLTFAALGHELDAHATSIYRHFRDKDELVLELIDAVRAKSYEQTLESTGDWREDLRAISRAIHDNYLRFPTLAPHMAIRTTRRPTEFGNVEFALAALRRAGLDDDECVTMVRVFGNFVRATSAIEAAIRALPADARALDEMAWRVEYRQLPEGQFPNIASLSDKLLPVGDPRIFEEGLELMLDAIEMRARRGQDARPA
jgi:AcrR family transcriptional regulator